MTVPFQNRTRIVFVWVAVIPVLLAALTFYSRTQFRRALHWVERTEQALDAIGDLMEAVTSAETAQRGYLLTGREQYLRPFPWARNLARQKLAELKQLTAGDSIERSDLTRIEDLIEAKFAELDKTVEQTRSGNRDLAIAEVNSDRGLRLMEEIRRSAHSIEAEEERVLRDRLRINENFDRAVNLSLVALVATTILLLILAGRLIAAFAATRDRALDEVRALNQALEDRVASRTRELAEANENLRRSNEDLERFAHVASHDLQEPLRMVASYVSLLRRQYRGRLGPEADDYIDFAVNGAVRMQNLIDDLLAYSQAGTQALKRAPASLDEILKETLENLAPAIEASGAAITRDPLPALSVDHVKLAQVFQNLLANSIKFRQPGRPLQIEVLHQRDGDFERFSVRDNGIGFEREHQERIFVMFQRLHSLQAYSGTGVGLAICKRVIEAHGGRIWAEGSPGEGAVFHFTLPAKT